MKSEPQALISVIVPAYNSEKHIKQTLECLMYQSYKALEIIVIDDGSTDATADIVRTFPVKLISQSNQGVATTRNIGMNEASGEYIHFLDADDIINLNFYENMMNVAMQTDADVLCCGFYHERLPAKSNQFSEIVLASETEDKYRLTNAGNDGYAVKYLFRKALIEDKNLQFNPDLRVAEDMVFSFQLIYWANRVASVPGASYYYKHRTSSVMTSGGKIQQINRKLEIKKARQLRDQFAAEHQISVIGNPKHSDVWFKLFGFIPLLKKRRFDTGRIRWYFLGICIMQRK